MGCAASADSSVSDADVSFREDSGDGCPIESGGHLVHATRSETDVLPIDDISDFTRLLTASDPTSSAHNIGSADSPHRIRGLIAFAPTQLPPDRGMASATPRGPLHHVAADTRSDAFEMPPASGFSGMETAATVILALQTEASASASLTSPCGTPRCCSELTPRGDELQRRSSHGSGLGSQRSRTSITASLGKARVQASSFRSSIAGDAMRPGDVVFPAAVAAAMDAASRDIDAAQLNSGRKDEEGTTAVTHIPIHHHQSEDAFGCAASCSPDQSHSSVSSTSSPSPPVGMALAAMLRTPDAKAASLHPWPVPIPPPASVPARVFPSNDESFAFPLDTSPSHQRLQAGKPCGATNRFSVSGSLSRSTGVAATSGVLGMSDVSFSVSGLLKSCSISTPAVGIQAAPEGTDASRSTPGAHLIPINDDIFGVCVAVEDE